MWPQLLPLILNKLYSRPTDSSIIKFLSAISIPLSEHIIELLPLINQRMQNQLRFLKYSFQLLSKIRFLFSLTEDLLTSKTEESIEFVQSLVFERIRPLLVLRVLPLKLFLTINITPIGN